MMRVGLITVVMALLMTGCATGPKTALRPKSLDSQYVVYFEQSDRIPKAVLLEAHKSAQPNAAAAAAITDDMVSKIVEKVIEEIVGVVPKVAETYSTERMNNALIGRRMLFKGYESPEQLKELNEIIKSMDNAIENMTPEK